MMRRIFGLTASMAILAASAATAQVTGIVTNRSVNYQLQVVKGASVIQPVYTGPVQSGNKQFSG
jgi:hypothetical protein